MGMCGNLAENCFIRFYLSFSSYLVQFSLTLVQQIESDDSIHVLNLIKRVSMENH